MRKFFTKKWVLNLLTGIFAAIFLVSVGLIIYEIRQSSQNKDRYDTLADIVDNYQNYTPTGSDQAGNTEAPNSPTVEEDSSGYKVITVTDPENGKSVEVMEKYAQIYLMNNDLVGWINIPGTKINYPVVQTPDDPNYYLDRDFYKKSSKYGCLYAREVCDVASPSDNVTIYGHNMKDGSMFANLLEYQRKGYFETHRTLTFDTLTEHHEYEIFSVFITTATEDNSFHYHRFVDAQTEEEFNQFVNMCNGYSLYNTGVTAKYGDKFICLSTCEYTHANGRFVVVAKRIS